MNTKKKPLFRRTQGAMVKRLRDKSWRRPDGKHNKIREGKIGKGKVPSIGYGAERSTKHLHPCGLEDVIVSNVKDIEGMESTRHAARISSKVGKRKKALLLEELKKRKIKVLNP
ncbi:MAG: eL32 family ribosomal protein [Candidatus Hydrothermarchaeales archaeon]